jgi:hypothetical protein
MEVVLEYTRRYNSETIVFPKHKEKLIINNILKTFFLYLFRNQKLFNTNF